MSIPATPSPTPPSNTPQQIPPMLPTDPPSLALAILALLMGIMCCAPGGIILGIVGMNKYQSGTPGWVISLIGLIMGCLSIVGNIIIVIADPTIMHHFGF